MTILYQLYSRQLDWYSPILNNFASAEWFRTIFDRRSIVSLYGKYFLLKWSRVVTSLPLAWTTWSVSRSIGIIPTNRRREQLVDPRTTVRPQTRWVALGSASVWWARPAPAWALCRISDLDDRGPVFHKTCGDSNIWWPPIHRPFLADGCGVSTRIPWWWGKTTLRY